MVGLLSVQATMFRQRMHVPLQNPHLMNSNTIGTYAFFRRTRLPMRNAEENVPRKKNLPRHEHNNDNLLRKDSRVGRHSRCLSAAENPATLRMQLIAL